jgi:hypothetical protein
MCDNSQDKFYILLQNFIFLKKHFITEICFFYYELLYIVQMLYTHVFAESKASYSKPTQLGITFAADSL